MRHLYLHKEFLIFAVDTRRFVPILKTRKVKTYGALLTCRLDLRRRLKTISAFELMDGLEAGFNAVVVVRSIQHWTGAFRAVTAHEP